MNTQTIMTMSVRLHVETRFYSIQKVAALWEELFELRSHCISIVIWDFSSWKLLPEA